MHNRERSGLLWKCQRKLPDENDSRIYKNGKRAVLKFTRQIAAHPRVRAQDRPISLGPAPRYIGEYWQHRQFIIVIPKEERIVPEENKTEDDDEQTN